VASEHDWLILWWSVHPPLKLAVCEGEKLIVRDLLHIPNPKMIAKRHFVTPPLRLSFGQLPSCEEN